MFVERQFCFPIHSMLKIFQRPLVQPTYGLHYSHYWPLPVSSKFKSEYVVVLINIFKRSAFSSMLRASRLSKQQNKLVLRLNSFKKWSPFWYFTRGDRGLEDSYLSGPLAKCRKSWAQSFLGEKISPSNGACSLD